MACSSWGLHPHAKRGSTPLSSLRGRIWPDGTWGAGFERKIKLGPPSVEKLCRSRSEFWLLAIAVHGIGAALAYVRSPDEWIDPSCGVFRDVPESSMIARPPLTLSESTNSDGRAPRGSQGITSFGRKMVRSAGVLLEEQYTKGRLTFCTLTIPYQDEQSWKDIMGHWAEIVGLTLRYVRGCLKSVGLSDAIVYCTELQQARFDRYGVPGYHLHLVWPNLRPGVWSVSVDALRERWGSILSNYVSSSGQENRSVPRVETQVVKKSVAGYLAKYLSKGVGTTALQQLLCRGIPHPSSWWGMSMSLRSAVKRQVVTLNDKAARLLMDGIVKGAWAGNIKEHRKEYDGRDVTLGYYGYVGEWGNEHPLRQMIDEEREERRNVFGSVLVNV